MPQATEGVLWIPCAGSMLPAILHDVPTAPGQRRVGALVIVGGPQYRVGSHRQFVLMARSLAARGFPVLRFDYRGMGDAGGPLRTFEDVAEDIAAALGAWLAKDTSLDGIVLWGLCDGASAAMMNCKSARVVGLALANPWVRSAASEAKALVTHYYANRFLSWAFWKKFLSGKVGIGDAVKGLLGKLRVALRGEETGPAAGDFRQRMLAGMKAFNGPVLLLVSGNDVTAKEFEDMVSSSSEWKQVVGRPAVTIVRLEDADHTFSRRVDLDRASDATADWMDQSFRR